MSQLRIAPLAALLVALPGAALPASAAAAGPAVNTGPALGVLSTTATVTGTVTPDGTPTTYRFEYGTSTAYGASTPARSTTEGTRPQNVIALLSGLRPRTLYHFRLIASSAAGTALGEDETFTTTAGGSPEEASQPQPRPKISALRITPHSFRALLTGPPFLEGTPLGQRRGALVSWRDTQDASTTFTVLRVSRGRLRRLGRFVHRDSAGPNRIRLTGRLRGHRLAPGSYRLRAVLRLGTRAGNTLSVAFRIRR